MAITNTFLVHKKNINETSEKTGETAHLNDGEVLFKIERYAFTANNITYAVCGYLLKYWNFFLTEEPFGIVPVWGFAEVAESKSDEIKVGEKFYGYFPMSNYLTVKAGKTGLFGFSDVAENRRELSPIYNFYARIAADASFREELKDYIPIIKPLFATSFLIYHFAKEENFFGGEQLILTSASSKTALALAFMFKQNRKTDGKKVVGLTSKGNVEFVRETGFYDDVIAYDEIEKISAENSVIIDFAGNAPLLKEIHQQLSDNLKYISRIGITDWQADKSFDDLPNVNWFFAPDHIENRYKEWGAEKTTLLLNDSLMKFIGETKEMLEIEYIQDFAALKELYGNMLSGKVNPKKGYIVKM